MLERMFIVDSNLKVSKSTTGCSSHFKIVQNQMLKGLELHE